MRPQACTDRRSSSGSSSSSKVVVVVVVLLVGRMSNFQQYLLLPLLSDCCYDGNDYRLRALLPLALPTPTTTTAALAITKIMLPTSVLQPRLLSMMTATIATLIFFSLVLKIRRRKRFECVVLLCSRVWNLLAHRLPVHLEHKEGLRDLRLAPL